MVDWQKVFIRPNNMCFGCGTKNPIGLKLNFQWDGEKAIAEFIPGENYQGWSGVVHGGIIANILDECAGWIMVHNNLFGVTAKLEVLYHNPAEVDVPLVITGSIVRNNGKRFEVRSHIDTKEGILIAEAKTLLIVMKNHSNNIQGKVNFSVIWDMDGVIVDTAACHFESWRYVFEKHNTRFTKSDFKKKFGQRNDAIIRSVLDRTITSSEIENIASDKEQYFRSCAKDKVKPLPGAVELIKSLAKKRVKMAIASSAPLENIELILNSLGIKECFQTLVPGKDVKESKPSPQIFLLAAHRLGVKPEECIVFEDAVTGVTGAKNAGMHCVAVTTTNQRNILSDADLIVDSLDEIKITELEALIKK
jgi:beta-phosphoglucomutase family hydrolase